METSVLTAYIVTFIVMVLLFGAAIMSAMMISFKPNNSDHISRKVWFWVLAIATPVISFLINFFHFYDNISVPTQRDKYLFATCIAAVIALILFIVLGVIFSKSTHGKLASWFN